MLKLLEYKWTLISNCTKKGSEFRIYPKLKWWGEVTEGKGRGKEKEKAKEREREGGEGKRGKQMRGKKEEKGTN